jgi:hypothetical protein
LQYQQAERNDLHPRANRGHAQRDPEHAKISVLKLAEYLRSPPAGFDWADAFMDQDRSAKMLVSGDFVGRSDDLEHSETLRFNACSEHGRISNHEPRISLEWRLRAACTSTSVGPSFRN